MNMQWTIFIIREGLDDTDFVEKKSYKHLYRMIVST